MISSAMARRSCLRGTGTGAGAGAGGGGGIAGAGSATGTSEEVGPSGCGGSVASYTSGELYSAHARAGVAGAAIAGSRKMRCDQIRFLCSLYSTIVLRIARPYCTERQNPICDASSK
jgi:hypothetical protein